MSWKMLLPVLKNRHWFPLIEFCLLLTYYYSYQKKDGWKRDYKKMKGFVKWELVQKALLCSSNARTTEKGCKERWPHPNKDLSTLLIRERGSSAHA